MKSRVCGLAKVATVLCLLLVNCRSQEVTLQVDKYLNDALAAGRFSGSVLIARNGKVLISKGYGMANRELNVPNLVGINGFAAQIMRYPDEKVLVVVLSNFSFAPVTDIEMALAEIPVTNKEPVK